MGRWNETAHTYDIFMRIGVMIILEYNFFQNILRLQHARSHCTLTAGKSTVATWMRQALVLRLIEEDLCFLGLYMSVTRLVYFNSFTDVRSFSNVVFKSINTASV